MTTRVRGGLLARNTLFNLAANAVPLVLGLVVIPIVVRGLGPARFGILALAWVMAGYFVVLDLGLGRATTKFVADALGRGLEDRIPSTVWTATALQAVVGVVGSAILVAVTPLIVERVLKVPTGLEGEAKAAFYVLALAIPPMLIGGALRGVLEAAQRFDLVNAVKAPASAGTLLGPLVGTVLGWSLPLIVLVIVIVQVAAASAYYLLTLRVFPSLAERTFRGATIRPLMSFGGWLTVSVVVGPVFAYLDRFVLGAVASLAAVTFYAAPYDMLTRLWVIPASLLAAIFPAMSTLGGAGRHEAAGLAARSLRYLILAMGPVFILIAVNAHEILRVWLGPEFAARSTRVLQILAVGVLVNYLAFVPYTFLQALGRADVTAKLHLAEVPLYVALVVWMVATWGAVGAALAWLIRAAVDAAVVLVAAVRVSGVGPRAIVDGRVVRTIGLVIVFGLAAAAVTAASGGLWQRALGFAAALSTLAILAWRHALVEPERARISKLVRQARVTQ
jgi:O-antigen/teichoic acid export membrane protein